MNFKRLHDNLPVLDRVNLPALFVATLAVRLAVMFLCIYADRQAWESRFALKLGYDDLEYVSIARQWAEQGEFRFPALPERQIYRTPGYPAFLCALGALLGWQPLLMLLVQASLLSFTPVLLALLLRRAQYPPGFAWLLAVDPITTILSLSFMTEGLFALVLLAGFFFLLRAERLWQRGLALAAFSAAILIKPSVQFFYVFLCVYLLIRFRPRVKTLFLILASALPLLGWMARNYHVADLLVVSTQTDTSIMIPETIRALEQDTPASQLIEHISNNWLADHDGEKLYAAIMDNKLDFSGVAIRYVLQHPVLFAKHHALGMARVLFGTCKVHMATVFPVSGHWPKSAWLAFNLLIIGFYGLLYAALLFTWRWRAIRYATIWLAWLFVLYNIALVGVLAYTTGGGLKRAPFIPFLFIALAGQWHYLRAKQHSRMDKVV